MLLDSNEISSHKIGMLQDKEGFSISVWVYV